MAGAVTAWKGAGALDCTIASGQTASGAVDLGSKKLCGVHLPAAFTGTALTFQTAPSLAGTYQTIKQADGTSLSVTVAQGTFVKLNPLDFEGLRYVKVVSGSAEGAVRTLYLAVK